MSAHFARAEMLYAQDRYDLAETECRKALAEVPEHPGVISLLALTLSALDRHDEAVSTAQNAVGLAPDEPYVHYCLAIVHLNRKKIQLAQHAIREAVQLDPENAEYRSLMASAHMARREYREALQAAEGGLELDPEHEQCTNLKAMALTQLGRKDEATRVIQGALQRDPDNSWTHSNQGWSHLHQNQPHKAAEHFREALRINPNNEHAKQGMLNALRAKNPIFRVMLAYFLWMSRLSGAMQWGIIIGLYFGYRFLGNLQSRNPEHAVWITPLLILYVLFVYLSWTSPALSNLLLRLNAYGKYLLDDDDLRASNFVGGTLLLAILSFAGGILTGQTILYAVGVFLLLIIIPVAGTFSRPKGSARTILMLYTLGLCALGGLALSLMAIGRGEAATPFISLFLIGMFAFAWVANALTMRKPA